MKKKLTLFLSLFLLGIMFATAQIQVSGIVEDEQGEPVVGATVLIKGTSQGAVTDFNGRFLLTAPSNATLVFSYVVSARKLPLF